MSDPVSDPVWAALGMHLDVWVASVCTTSDGTSVQKVEVWGENYCCALLATLSDQTYCLGAVWSPHAKMQLPTFAPGPFLSLVLHQFLFLNHSKILFLSDPSLIIGNPCQWLPHWLTPSHLVDLIDVTLVCEDANSKLFEVVTLPDVDYEDRVGNSLLQIWKLRFGHKA